jgi:hypothetical protein
VLGLEAYKKRVVKKIKESDTWRDYLTERSSLPVRGSDNVELSRTTTLNTSPAQNAARVNGALETSPERRTAIAEFLKRCNDLPDLPRKITRTDIRKSVKHRSSRQLEYWQAVDPKATREDDQNFRRILRMEPAQFIERLKNLQILN